MSSPFSNEVKIKLTKIIDNSKTLHLNPNPNLTPFSIRVSKRSTNPLRPSDFLAGKQFSSIDHSQIKRILSGQTPTSDERRPQTNFWENPTSSSLQQTIRCPSKKFAFFKKHRPFNETTNTLRQKNYAGRLTAKQYYKNLDIMNRSSPLEALKQLTKSYSKVHKEGDGTRPNTKEHQQNKKLNDKSLEILINSQKQNLPNNMMKTQKNTQVQKLIKKWKQRQQSISRLKNKDQAKNQNQLQQNIILRKSFSCKVSFQEFQQGNFITEQKTAEFPLVDLKKEFSKVAERGETLPVESQNQDSIVLLHREPLEQYMEIFFDPTEQVKTSKKKPKPLELIKIKPKKLSTRNIECFQRLKKNLFKDRTRRDIFANETLKNTMEFPKFSERSQQDEKIRVPGHKRPENIFRNQTPDPNLSKRSSKLESLQESKRESKQQSKRESKQESKKESIQQSREQSKRESKHEMQKMSSKREISKMSSNDEISNAGSNHEISKIGIKNEISKISSIHQVSKISSNHSVSKASSKHNSFCKFLKTPRKSAEIAGIAVGNLSKRSVEPEEPEQQQTEANQQNQTDKCDSQENQQVQRLSLKSSRISFSEDQSPEAIRNSFKGQSRIKGW